MIYASRKQASPKLFARVIKSRQYKHFVLDNFLSDIEMVPWAMMEYVDDPIKAWKLWKQSFLSVADLTAPFKRERVKLSSIAPWLSNEIKLLMCERDRVKGIVIITGDHMKWTEYKSFKNQLNHFIKACKKDYYHSYFAENVGKVKATWNCINSRKKNIAQPSKLVIGDNDNQSF